MPYNVSNDAIYALQVYWDSGFTIDISEGIKKAEEVYEKQQQANSPEAVGQLI